MRRRSFLATPLLLPSLSSAAAVAAAVVYPAVEAGAELVFPRDHGAHPAFRTEWWYVTGALDAPQPDVGFQFTFFRSRPGIAEGLRSPIAARQIVFAHAALTVPGEGLQHAERAAPAPISVRASPATTWTSASVPGECSGKRPAAGSRCSCACRARSFLGTCR